MAVALSRSGIMIAVCLSTLDTDAKYSGLIALSPDGNLLASGYCGIRIWDIHRGECLKTLGGCIGSINAIGFTSNGQIITAETLGIMICDVESGKCLRTFRRSYETYSLALSLDGHVVSSTGDGRIEIWNPEGDGAPKMLLGHTVKAISIALSSIGNIISGSEDYTDSEEEDEKRNDQTGARSQDLIGVNDT
ncbi:WD40 repeat-like protein [Aspergillus japonicus CBS 114.51]|uniref:Mitochondrial division protein 1 n=1 Tax=Aspergillus japonicus CBS 114.51 TaxID=1448312 RepID=A0A8T8X4G6_ASPJA|nr:WD40 repeat-like protein [Aspergillus japonicus CBS 114.51]RAH82834.1 WD40 repeat-like protein [Aspergillus japonicus CBS 114.51]